MDIKKQAVLEYPTCIKPCTFGEKMRLFITIAISFSLIFCGNRKNTIQTDNVKATAAKLSSPDTTVVFVQWDTQADTMKKSRAWLYENKINLSLSNEKTYEKYYLDLEKNAANWEIQHISQPSPTDCLYVASNFRILKQVINLNKEKFNNGEIIHGSVDLIMLGRKPMVREPLIPFIDKRKWDTVRVKGIFSSTIN